MRRLARPSLALEPFPQPPLRPTRHPVMLMHGYGALASFLPGGMLHAEAMYLRERGVRAYAPHVNPYETVAVRARQWGERLEHVFEETTADKVNLIGFSLGGLDARHLALDPRWEGRIASIVTVATPHAGTPLASHLLDGNERLAAWSIQAMRLVGRATWKQDPPNVAAALAELTPAHVTGVFEPAHPLPAGVWCASYSARVGSGTYPPLRVSQRLLQQLAGENDGLVPTASAVWAEHLGTVDADHARLVGLRAGRGLDSREFYLGVVEELRKRGM